MWSTIGIIVALVEGALALGTLLFTLIYWKGGMDQWRKAHEDEHNKYPVAETFLMCKTMWECWEKDALGKRPDLAHHSSAFKLTQDGQDLIPEPIKETLCEMAKVTLDKEDLFTGWLVVTHLGIPAIETIAKEKKLSVQETIAILSTYVANFINNGRANNC